MRIRSVRVTHKNGRQIEQTRQPGQVAEPVQAVDLQGQGNVCRFTVDSHCEFNVT